MPEHAGWRPGQMSFRDLTRPDPYADHGRRVSTLVTPFGNVIEIADETDEDFRHVMFREVFSAYLNGAPE